MTKKIEKTPFDEIEKVVGIGYEFYRYTYDSNGQTTFYNGRHIKLKRGQL